MISSRKPVIFCDFDGTITITDNIVAIMKHFKPQGHEKIMEDTIKQRISLHEGVSAMFALIPSSQREEIISFVLEYAGIREGFQQFLYYLKKENIEFYVTSGGMDFFIDPLLQPFQIPQDHIYCNGADFSGEHIKITWPNPCLPPCENSCGMCKTTVIRQFPEDTYLRILIGDSLTDFEGAKIADLVYSRSWLTTKCEELGVNHVPFETFHDIISDLQQKQEQGVL
ncbi:2-hydroxy-3-keto-5-methylthiopentenyl-1-phosphate phosphatase [Paenibacillus sp. IHBB 10380]|uniref:2-hydroxy-3-keto-5-methylthiopentenyl-1- phosphate phosphatase n=1 Tax=Paenibacillus sp. IHBB 10380 TaxID=1566358 RepID=UPI0005CFDF86|nr:2-hydroxy-3-keto-5-methylthiopentenyl-1-phosphate phosphatase [Paenibacillus sp. IHBB 10380]AJS58088.1 2-hydroxy-3-keto-5-methylthiopentenyl-1-phosphate phosphatase [Paenibacillus sp. IHBB 10380]